MSKTTISEDNTTVLWEFATGTSASTVINKPGGWGMYEEIIMDLKATKDIDAKVLLRLTVGSGLTVTDESLLIKITYEQTKQLRVKTIYADIKYRIGDQVEDPIPYIITNKNSVTNL